jgi:GT2 family glycosyltransferase
MKKIDLIIISFNRLDDLKETVKNVLEYRNSLNKIFIIDNNSNDGTDIWLNSLNDDIFTVVLSKTNLGVAGGRNIGIEKSDADILVFLDDDAIFNIANNPFLIVQDEFNKDESLGIIAFKITNYYSKKVQRYEFPFADKRIDEDKRNMCAYYVGAGHAISKEVFEKCGVYPEDYFYGKEELDLSLRAINNGFKLVYNPSIEIFHKQSPKGRQKNDEKWTQVYRNRLIISYKYYPLVYKLTSNTLWFIKILLITGSIKIPINAIKRYKKARSDLNKNILSANAIEYIKKHSGRLYY